MDLQGCNERSGYQHNDDLTDFNAGIERGERQGQRLPRQVKLCENTGEAKTVNQAKSEGEQHPRISPGRLICTTPQLQ